MPYSKEKQRIYNQQYYLDRTKDTRIKKQPSKRGPKTKPPKPPQSPKKRGRPRINDHLTPEELKARRAAFSKAWRENNPEKARASSRNSYEKFKYNNLEEWTAKQELKREKYKEEQKLYPAKRRRRKPDCTYILAPCYVPIDADLNRISNPILDLHPNPEVDSNLNPTPTITPNSQLDQ